MEICAADQRIPCYPQHDGMRDTRSTTLFHSLLSGITVSDTHPKV